jgi:hypothetical protein
MLWLFGILMRAEWKDAKTPTDEEGNPSNKQNPEERKRPLADLQTLKTQSAAD